MSNEAETTEKKKRTTPFETFPVGETTVAVTVRGGREETKEDLEHAITACELLAAKLTKRLTALGEQAG